MEQEKCQNESINLKSYEEVWPEYIKTKEKMKQKVRIYELEYIKRAGPLLCVRYWLRSDRVPRKLRHDEIPTYVRST